MNPSRRFLTILGFFITLLSGCNGQAAPQELNILCIVIEETCEGMIEEFTRHYPNITVRYVRMSSGEALTRLRDEKDKPQFDLWYGGPIDAYIVAKVENLLISYDSPNYKNLTDPVRFKDPDNVWVGIYVGSLGFCTNNDWLAAHPGVEPPRSWDDLLKPEFEGQVMVAHPSTSGTSYTLVSTILQTRGEEEGWNYLQNLTDQIYQFTVSGAKPSELVGQGEAAVCITFSHDIIRKMQDQKMPLTLTFPAEGTGYEIGGMALIKGAKNQDAAKKWFDWSLTAEAQTLFPKYQSYQGPTVTGVTHPFPELLNVSLINYDFNLAAENKTTVVERFTNQIATADNLRE